MSNSSYNDLHRLFLQAMMSRAIVGIKGAKAILQNIVGLVGYRTEIKEHDVTETIDEINRKISSFGMELREILSEQTGEKFIVLVNVVDNSAVYEKIDHIYSVKEREVFRLLLEATVQKADEYGSVSTIDALHLPVQNMRPGEIQDVIDKLVSDQWFLETDAGRLAPAPRCIAEFDMYLKRNFENYVQICVCSNVVFSGWNCPHCNAISHNHCFKTFNSRKESVTKCPTCKKPVDSTADATQNGDEETPQQKKRKNKTQDTPQNTPRPSASSQDDTPLPTRGRRKRPSAE